MRKRHHEANNDSAATDCEELINKQLTISRVRKSHRMNIKPRDYEKKYRYELGSRQMIGDIYCGIFARFSKEMRCIYKNLLLHNVNDSH